MTSIVRVEALSGVRDDSPLCYLLQVDDTYLLLDCGWDDNFDMFFIEAVRRRVPQISAVLLSYPDPAHLGALPYLVAKCGLTAPIYATVPVYKMGQMFMYDWLNAHESVEDFKLFSLDDVDAAFERVQQVKHNQQILLKGDCGLQVTPLNAGHMIGGSIWSISKMGDDEIVYAVDFNHKKEKHLNGCAIESIQRPHLLITDAFNAMYKTPNKKHKDERLVQKMADTFSVGGDCLIVIDTAGRVLEVAHMLDQLWTSDDFKSANLVMLSHVASSVVEFAKSQVEWMSEKILKSFETGRYNPFQFRNLILCHSHAELMRIRSPKVVLCSDLSMECGFSRELFIEWCSDSRNSIFVTGRSGERTLGSKLIRMANSINRGEKVNRQLTLEMKRRIRLEGRELEEYRAHKRNEEQEEQRRKLEATRHAQLLNIDDSDSDDEENEEAIASAVAAMAVNKTSNNSSSLPSAHLSSSVSSLRKDSKTAPPAPIGGTGRSSSTAGVADRTNQHAHDSHVSAHDLLLKWESQHKSSFFKQSKKTFPMFGYVEEKVKWDEYGEIIRPQDYTIDSALVSEKENKRMSGEDDAMMEGHRADNGHPQEEAEEATWPTKCIKYITKLEVLCHVEFIEFEGRSDGESLMKIVSQMKPKQLVVVHGSNECTRFFCKNVEESGAVLSSNVFAPKLGEIVDATIESHIFQVALSDALLSSFSLQKVKEAELAWIDARFIRKLRESTRVKEEEEEEEEREILMEGEDGEGEPLVKRMKNVKAQEKLLLDCLPSTSIPTHTAVFVNEPKLSDVKQVLVSEGFQAEFSAGVLYINGVASVKRNEAGRFHVEGCASEEYFRIRDIIYNQFAIV